MSWSRFRRLCAAVLMAAGVLTVPGTAQAASVTCEDVYVPVSILLLPQTVYGRLCTPEGARTVMVLVPGSTYTSHYWDIDTRPENSFRRSMNQAGIATLTVDRLGTGRSSKPLSALVSTVTQADAMHGVVQRMRGRFGRVLIGGHSLGSAISILEAGRYRDVDGVLLTGFTPRLDVVSAVPVFASLIPATLEPRFLGLDPGYLTTSPGTRYSSFHAPGVLQTDLIADDESTKSVVSVAEPVDTIVLNNYVLPAALAIRAPVMLVMADGDEHFCGPPLGSDCTSAAALKASEAHYYGGGVRFDTYVLRGYGHSFNYAPNAQDYHAAVATWATSLT